MARLEELANKMEELAPYAIPSKNHDDLIQAEYYRIQGLYRKEKARINAELDNEAKPAKTFVNSDCEATHREITTQTYKNQQARLSKEVMSFIR